MIKIVVQLDPDRVLPLIQNKLTTSAISNGVKRSKATISLWSRGGGIPAEQAHEFADVLGVLPGDILNEDSVTAMVNLLQRTTHFVSFVDRNLLAKALEEPGLPDCARELLLQLENDRLNPPTTQHTF